MVSRQRRTRPPKSRSAKTGRVSSAHMLQRERSVSAYSGIPAGPGPPVSMTITRKNTSLMWVPRSWVRECSDSTTSPTIRVGVAGGAKSRPFEFQFFVLTRNPRPSIEMAGGTTFHFLNTTPFGALQQAVGAANGRDARIGGGATVVRDFLKAGLVDRLHVAIAPILLGRGIRPWDDLRGLEAGYTVKAETAPSGTSHLTFQRKPASR
jgi:dihydrofolate reductase